MKDTRLTVDGKEICMALLRPEVVDRLTDIMMAEAGV